MTFDTSTHTTGFGLWGLLMFVALGVEAVAIVFLHSYAHPAHERRAAEIVAEEFPAAAISISSDVLPVFREYERSMATALNAYVQRLVGTYIGRLQTGLATATSRRRSW